MTCLDQLSGRWPVYSVVLTSSMERSPIGGTLPTGSFRFVTGFAYSSASISATFIEYL